ncbi:hypothetical protein ABZ322_33595, partial [Streptomyces sp. NPDC006129]
MGRHSRRGPVAKGDTADTTAVRDGRAGQAQTQGPRAGQDQGQGQASDMSRGGRPVPPGAGAFHAAWARPGASYDPGPTAPHTQGLPICAR